MIFAQSTPISQLFLVTAIALVAYMTAWFVAARLTRRLDLVDTAWGGSFIVTAWLAVAYHPAPAPLLAALLVTIWGGRLMYYTYSRHRRHDTDDPRYTRLTAKWQTAYWWRVFGGIFMFQGVLAFVIGLPLLLNSRADAIGLWAGLGTLVWIVGFYFEAVGDYQMQRFKADAANKGKVLQSGLWRYSRHPNFFGEVTQWVGIGLIALAAPWGWLGLIGPATIATLILFVSGIPTVERGKDKDPAYRQYQRTTSRFVPLPPRKG